MRACRARSPASTEFAPAVFTDPRVNRLLPAPARRLLAAGHWFQAPDPFGIPGTFHVQRARMAQIAGVSAIELTRLLRLLTRLGLHRYVGRRGLYVGVTARDNTLHTRWHLVPVRQWTPLERQPDGRFLAPGDLLVRLAFETERRWGGARKSAGAKPKPSGAPSRPGWGGARKGAGRSPKNSSSSGSTNTPESLPTVRPQVSSKPSVRASARGNFFRGSGEPASVRLSRSRLTIVRKPLERELPLVPTRRSRVMPSRRTGGTDVLQRIRALGERALPPAPDSDLVPPVRVPSPAKLRQPPVHPADEVLLLARAYRSVLKQRTGAVSLFMLRGDVLAHKDFARLREAAHLLRELDVPPVAWVLFSFDVWAEHGPERARNKPPTVSFVFSTKRIAERFDWFDRERDRYTGTRHFMAPAHRQLCEDHAAMFTELMRLPLENRDEVLAVVDRYFPGDSFERRLNQARAEARKLQDEVTRAVEMGSLL